MGKMRFLDGGIPNSSSGNSARRVDVSPRKPETTSLPHAAQHDLSASGRKIGPEDSGKGRQRVGIKKLLDPQNGSDGKPIASPLPHLMRAVAAADPTGTTGSALVTAMLDARPMGMAGLLNSLKSMWTGSSPAVSAQTHLHQFRDVAGKLGIGEKTHDGHLDALRDAASTLRKSDSARFREMAHAAQLSPGQWTPQERLLMFAALGREFALSADQETFSAAVETLPEHVKRVKAAQPDSSLPDLVTAELARTEALSDKDYADAQRLAQTPDASNRALLDTDLEILKVDVAECSRTLQQVISPQKAGNASDARAKAIPDAQLTRPTAPTNTLESKSAGSNRPTSAQEYLQQFRNAAGRQGIGDKAINSHVDAMRNAASKLRKNDPVLFREMAHAALLGPGHWTSPERLLMFATLGHEFALSSDLQTFREALKTLPAHMEQVRATQPGSSLPAFVTAELARTGEMSDRDYADAQRLLLAPHDSNRRMLHTDLERPGGRWWGEGGGISIAAKNLKREIGEVVNPLDVHHDGQIYPQIAQQLKEHLLVSKSQSSWARKYSLDPAWKSKMDGLEGTPARKAADALLLALWATGSPDYKSLDPSIMQTLFGLAQRSGSAVAGLEKLAGQVADANTNWDAPHASRQLSLTSGGTLASQNMESEQPARAMLCRLASMAKEASALHGHAEGIYLPDPQDAMHSGLERVRARMSRAANFVDSVQRLTDVRQELLSLRRDKVPHGAGPARPEEQVPVLNLLPGLDKAPSMVGRMLGRPPSPATVCDAKQFIQDTELQRHAFGIPRPEFLNQLKRGIDLLVDIHGQPDPTRNLTEKDEALAKTVSTLESLSRQLHETYEALDRPGSSSAKAEQHKQIDKLWKDVFAV